MSSQNGTDSEFVDKISHSQIEEKVREAVGLALELEPDEFSIDASLFDELAAESLDLLDATFMLEREFNILFPRTDVLQRATQYFGKDTLIKDGLVTEMGVTVLRLAMPEVAPDKFTAGMKSRDVTKVFTVNSLVRITSQLIDAKESVPRPCPKCGAIRTESDVMPELICPECSNTEVLPSGDDVMLNDMERLVAETGGMGMEPLPESV